MRDDNFDVRKALTTLAIENSLLDIGKPVYDKVTETLKKRYNCHLPDCYEHPEYLKEILKELYGDSHDVVVKSINEQLKDFSNQKPIARFLRVISR